MPFQPLLQNHETARKETLGDISNVSQLVSPKPLTKGQSEGKDPNSALQATFDRESDIDSEDSVFLLEPNNRRRSHGLVNVSNHTPCALSSQSESSTWRSRCTASWLRNKGLALVILAQFFGVIMNVCTRLLERPSQYGPQMHPFQILFTRMVGTLILGFTYQWLAKVKDAPFGPREVWLLLIARGVGGFFGVYGMYYSLIYLPLSDATVIAFLAPIVACWACSILIKEPFTRKEQMAGLVSFLGVILIARPVSVFSSAVRDSPTSPGAADHGLASGNSSATTEHDFDAHVTPAQRLTAVGVALTGVLGAACAYTTIRWIGKRAHPLISVNYFAAWSTLVSTVALAAIKDIHFQLPAGWMQWALLLVLGVCGFVMQFLITAGLQYEKGSRATNMVYTQMLFALAFDKIVWNTSPGIASLCGSSLILGSALYVAIVKNKPTKSNVACEGVHDEEQALMDDESSSHEESGHEGGRSMRGVQEVQLRTLRV